MKKQNPKPELTREERRTIQQNRALHLYFQLLADELNAAGLDMRKVLNPGIDIEWTKDNVKEYLWRPIQYELTRKAHTRHLSKTREIDGVYDTINRHLSEKFGLHVPFPSLEEVAKIPLEIRGKRGLGAVEFST